MATRGRKRQHDATIPAHIDQGAIPRGVYWDRTGSGRWYVFERDVDGRAKRKTIAPRDAKLSDLHRIIEQRAGVDRSALGWKRKATTSPPLTRTKTRPQSSATPGPNA